MSRPLPFPGLPARRRRRIHWGIVLAVAMVFVSIGLIVNAVRSQRPVHQAKKVNVMPKPLPPVPLRQAE